MSYSVLNRRLSRMDKQQKRQAAFVGNPTDYEFRVAPSCPPDLRLHMRGGFMWGAPGAPNSGSGWFVDPITIDFEDIAQTGFSGSYVNPYWYRGVFVSLRQGALPPGFVQQFNMWNTDEVETAAEAEQDIMTDIFTLAPWLSDYPLCAIILRNNGVTGANFQIQPIDAVNRQRSYYWRDLRPRYMTKT